MIILLACLVLPLGENLCFKRKLQEINKQEEDMNNIGSNLLGDLLQVAKDNANESIESLEIILDEKIQSITPMIEVRVKVSSSSNCCTIIRSFRNGYWYD